MQSKSKVVYICSSCQYQSAKWLGRCTSCGAWDSFIEEAVSTSSKMKLVRKQSAKITKLSEISTEGEFRITTGIGELDRVLGGGIIPGSLVLIGGDPGIGKSTLTLQMCGNLAKHNPLYVTGEESLNQIKYRSKRLKNISDDISLMAETNLEMIADAIKNTDCGVVIIDSIQSVYTEKIDATPGSIIQIRECTALLMQIAKQISKPIFIVGHVTKEGSIAGPKILEHMVDTVLQFEGDKTYSYRILRAIKNRYGSTNEIGVFEMAEDGLREVSNPSELFLVARQSTDSGISIVASIEGTRPILLEIQALVTPTSFAVPQRTATGFDIRRLQMIIAVLEKRLGSKFRNYDVFVNVAGGVYLNDPSVDLGVATALVSSLKDIAIDPKTVLIGEIGLTGEVRSVSSIEQRIKEAEKLGFQTIMLPKLNMDKISIKSKVRLVPVDRISLAFTQLFPD